MHITKYIETLESLAVESGKRSLCEAAADEMMDADIGMDTTLNAYMINVGTEFRTMMLEMGKDVTEYAVNEAFKQNSDYVFNAFECGVSAKTVAAKLYGDALAVPPKPSYVEPVHYTSSNDDGTLERYMPVLKCLFRLAMDVRVLQGHHRAVQTSCRAPRSFFQRIAAGFLKQLPIMSSYQTI